MPLDLELEKLPERCHWKKKKFQKKGKDRSRKSLAQLLYFADIYVVYLQVWTRVFLAVLPICHHFNIRQTAWKIIVYTYSLCTKWFRRSCVMSSCQLFLIPVAVGGPTEGMDPIPPESFNKLKVTGERHLPLTLTTTMRCKHINHRLEKNRVQ